MSAEQGRVSNVHMEHVNASSLPSNNHFAPPPVLMTSSLCLPQLKGISSQPFSIPLKSKNETCIHEIHYDSPLHSPEKKH
ncbi:hypothetical protein VTH06DRAFT_3400 [Thermothelomyces fergusii]